MRKNRRDYFKKKYRTIFSVLIVMFVITIFVCGLMNFTINKNVFERVTDESQFLAKQQAELINQEIDEQFHQVSTISGMVERGLLFSDEKDQKILQTYVEKNRLCMLAYADEKGEVITYQGKNIGNIADREYYSDIITGKKEFVCQYLKTPQGGSDPRVIFSTGVYQNGKIKGVVFLSKEIEVLSNSFFQQSMFDNNENSMLVDNNGDILVKNLRAEQEYNSIQSIYDIYSKSEKRTQSLFDKQSGSLILGKDSEDVLAYSNVETNDWYLLCVINLDTARQEYASNLMSIKRLTILLCIGFLIGIIYFLFLIYLQIKKVSR